MGMAELATYTAANSTGAAKITALNNSGQFAIATVNLLEIHMYQAFFHVACILITLRQF